METKHLNLTQQLVHELGRSILQGTYKVGDKLPSEAELSESYTLSRTATREAVKMLTAKGLISSRPRNGISVQEQKNWNLFDSDVLHWILVGQPDLHMLRQFLQLRQPIEAQAAALAAEFATAHDLEQIEVALAKMKLAQDNSCDSDSHEADLEFHQAVLSATNNPFFVQLKNFIATALKVNLRFTNRLNPVTRDEYQAHEDLYLSIKEGSPQKAFDEAMKTQIMTLNLVNDAIEKLEQE
jgi:DNA-binding FadR family transcriptional regulator